MSQERSASDRRGFSRYQSRLDSPARLAIAGVIAVLTIAILSAWFQNLSSEHDKEIHKEDAADARAYLANQLNSKSVKLYIPARPIADHNLQNVNISETVSNGIVFQYYFQIEIIECPASKAGAPIVDGYELHTADFQKSVRTVATTSNGRKIKAIYKSFDEIDYYFTNIGATPIVFPVNHWRSGPGATGHWHLDSKTVAEFVQALAPVTNKKVAALASSLEERSYAASQNPSKYVGFKPYKLELLPAGFGRRAEGVHCAENGVIYYSQKLEHRRVATAADRDRSMYKEYPVVEFLLRVANPWVTDREIDVVEYSVPKDFKVSSNCGGVPPFFDNGRPCAETISTPGKRIIYIDDQKDAYVRLKMV